VSGGMAHSNGSFRPGAVQSIPDASGPSAERNPMTRIRSSLALLLLRRVPFWTSSRLRRVARLVTLAIYLYVLHIVALLCFEYRLAFPGWTFDREWATPPAGVFAEELNLTASDGNSIRAWWFAPEGWTADRGAVVFAHGNGRNLSHCGGNLRRWRDALGAAVLGFDYPGYGQSSGRPNEESCYASANAAFDWVVGVGGVRPKDVVLVGESMGTAMAVDLASRHDCRMLVLMGAYTSFPDAAQHQFFWIPSRHLVSLRFDNLGKIGSIRTPLFVAHGTADKVVPFSQGERLFEAAHGPKRFYPMANHPHMHPRHPSFYDQVRKFMAETRKGSP
jgi:pimeloyl-ACP methyl ester carboxylesterase